MFGFDRKCHPAIDQPCRIPGLHARHAGLAEANLPLKRGQADLVHPEQEVVLRNLGLEHCGSRPRVSRRSIGLAIGHGCGGANAPKQVQFPGKHLSGGQQPL
ncbi:hypothetical protein G6F46_014854 [Rhizopus delemar]|nr:hypothetical protein G6F46_014854 [Rhizopus delemar]